METERETDDRARGMDALHARICGHQRELFRLIAEADRSEDWRDSGARDMAHWLAMRYDLSWWKAQRWVAAAHALEALPRIAEAFSSGEVGIDKVVELTRFATPQTEGHLIAWARGVSAGCIRRRADVASRPPDRGRPGRRDRPVPVLVVHR